VNKRTPKRGDPHHEGKRVIIPTWIWKLRTSCSQVGGLRVFCWWPMRESFSCFCSGVWKGSSNVGKKSTAQVQSSDFEDKVSWRSLDLPTRDERSASSFAFFVKIKRPISLVPSGDSQSWKKSALRYPPSTTWKLRLIGWRWTLAFFKRQSASCHVESMFSRILYPIKKELPCLRQLFKCDLHSWRTQETTI